MSLRQRSSVHAQMHYSAQNVVGAGEGAAEWVIATRGLTSGTCNAGHTPFSYPTLLLASPRLFALTLTQSFDTCFNITRRTCICSRRAAYRTSETGKDCVCPNVDPSHPGPRAGRTALFHQCLVYMRRCSHCPRVAEAYAQHAAEFLEYSTALHAWRAEPA